MSPTGGQSRLRILQCRLIEPGSPDVLSNLGIALGAEHRGTEALKAFRYSPSLILHYSHDTPRKALKIDPNLRMAHVNIANYYRYHGAPEKATLPCLGVLVIRAPQYTGGSTSEEGHQTGQA